MWALLLSAFLVVGCTSVSGDVDDNTPPNTENPGNGDNPDDDENPGNDDNTDDGENPGNDDNTDGKPVITLAQIEIEADKFTFEVKTTVEGTLGYAVVGEGVKAPSIDDMFAANSVEVVNKLNITVDNLNDKSNYTLYAILRAKEGGVLSAPKNLKFTTPDDGTANPITIKSATVDTIIFTIDIAGSYVFQCIDKLEVETAYGITIEDYITMPGIGIPASGPIEVEWINGGKYGVYDMFVRPDSDFYVIAAIAEGQEVVGDIFYKTVHTPKLPEANSDVVLELSDITSNSVKIKTTPDSNTVEYVVYVRDRKWSDDIINRYSRTKLADAVEASVGVGGWKLTQANEDVWKGLMPNTEYACHVVFKDAAGNRTLDITHFTTLATSQPAPVVELSLTNPTSDYHNKLNVNIFSEDAAKVQFAFNTKVAVDEQRNLYNSTDAEIVKEFGMWLTSEQVEAIRTTGLTLVQEDLFPEIEYVALITVLNEENTPTTKVTAKTTKAKATPKRVESDLFTSLLGKWRVSYDLVQYNGKEVRITGAEVTIAKGADSSTEEYYRSQNRLVIQGWPFNVEHDGTHVPLPYMSPTDLKDASNVWKNNPGLAMRDYGPKIFFEIAEGDVVTVPSERGEYFYNWSTDGTFYFYGADFDNEFTAPTTFPVTVSEDGNTITIDKCVSGEEFGYGVYYPSVFRMNAGTLSYWNIATSKIILERVK